MDELAVEYRVFGTRWARDTSPLYEAWATTIASDPELLALLGTLPPAKRQPNLVFAAARWEGAPLVTGAVWRDWLVAHWSDVARTALARRTQTNEPGRCATLLPALAAIGGPLALLEVGASAGLCLYPDQYAYRYESADGDRSIAGPASRWQPLLHCRLARPGDAPSGRPEVVWRRGIDLDPVDVRDAESVRWLETLVWPGPDHDARVLRLRDAAAIAAALPPVIVRGDLLDRLEDVAATSPADATLVVFHSAVLMYLSPADRERFAVLVGGLGRRIGRRVVWLAQEAAGVLGIPLPDGVDADGRFVQAVDGVPVALAGQHGATYAPIAAPGA